MVSCIIFNAMRNIVIYLFCILTLAMSSCEGVPSDGVKTPKIEITSESKIRVDANGGHAIITYELINVSESAEVSVSVVNKELITSVDHSEYGKILFTITPNTTDDIREGAIVISYEELTSTVLVYQHVKSGDDPNVEEITVEANQLVGSYYGESLASGMGHYWVIITRDGFVDGNVQPNTSFYRLDVLGPVAADLDNIRVPDGTYRFDPYNELREFTLLNLSSDYSYIDADGEGWALPYTDVTLTVEGNRFELDAIIGEEHHVVTFEGDYTMSYVTITDHISSLENDVVINLDNCTPTVMNYGDYWECGYNNWGIEFVCNQGLKEGVYLVLDLITESNTTCAGTYRAADYVSEDSDEPLFEPGVFVPGFRVSDDSDLLLGSLYVEYDNGLALEQAPLSVGTVDITDNGNGTYTIVIDCYDDAPTPNHLSLNWTGRL